MYMSGRLREIEGGPYIIFNIIAATSNKLTRNKETG